MQRITAQSVLLRSRPEMPTDLELTKNEFEEGWSFVRSGALRLEKKLHKFGWQVIRTNDESRQGGVGATAQQAIYRALELALRRTNEDFNGLEVRSIRVTTYPWFVLARLEVLQFKIQQAPVRPQPDSLFPLSASIRRKGSPANAPWLTPVFQCDPGQQADLA